MSSIGEIFNEKKINNRFRFDRQTNNIFIDFGTCIDAGNSP